LRCKLRETGSLTAPWFRIPCIIDLCLRGTTKRHAGAETATARRAYAKSHQLAQRPPFECIALQGGGALGSYQAGVYEALAEADLHPYWVAAERVAKL